MKAMVLVGVSASCFWGCFLDTPSLVENGSSREAHESEPAGSGPIPKSQI